MAKQRPAAVTVIGVLNLVYGVAGLLLALCGGLAIALEPHIGPAGATDVETYFQQQWQERLPPGYDALMLGSVVLGGILGVLLIVAGIGLLKLARWGRTLSLIVAAVTIPLLVGRSGYDLAVGVPAMNGATNATEAHFRNDPNADPTELRHLRAINELGVSAAIVGPALPLLYPFAVLLFLNRREVKAVFARPEDEPHDP